MNTFVTFEAVKYGETATFFTVTRTENGVQRPKSELADFHERMEVILEVAADLREIEAQLERISEAGFSPELLRDEVDLNRGGGGAKALPGKEWNIRSKTFRPVEEGPLRLYCVLLPHEIIILCNGDRKTAHSAQDCPNVKPHFDFVNNLSARLEERLDQEPKPLTLEQIEGILETETIEL